MFFRRQKPHVPTFEERLDCVRQAGFQTVAEPAGGVRVIRNGCAAVVTDVAGDRPHVSKAGWLIDGQIAALVDLGYQKVWQTPDGHREAATADQLKALHAFEEDLKEALGLESLYHESLGTTNDLHLYDRVADRDRGIRKPWQRPVH
jgi:hypothetical protein